MDPLASIKVPLPGEAAGPASADLPVRSVDAKPKAAESKPKAAKPKPEEASSAPREAGAAASGAASSSRPSEGKGATQDGEPEAQAVSSRFVVRRTAVVRVGGFSLRLAAGRILDPSVYSERDWASIRRQAEDALEEETP